MADFDVTLQITKFSCSDTCEDPHIEFKHSIVDNENLEVILFEVVTDKDTSEIEEIAYHEGLVTGLEAAGFDVRYDIMHSSELYEEC